MKIEDKIKKIDSLENLCKIISDVEGRLNELNEHMSFLTMSDEIYPVQQASLVLEDLVTRLEPYKEIISFFAYVGIGATVYRIFKTQEINNVNVITGVISLILLGVKKFIKMMSEVQSLTVEYSNEIEYYQNISAMLKEHLEFLRNNPDYVTGKNYSPIDARIDMRKCWNAQRFYYRNQELLEKKYRKGKLDKFLTGFAFYNGEPEQIKEMVEEGLGQSRNLTREENCYS